MSKKKASALRVLLELFIVFIGVYGAFELNRYQEGKREQKLKKNYFNSFQSELIKLSSEIESSQKLIDKRLAELDSSTENGQKLPLKPLNLYFGSEMLISRAGFNDDVFTQLSAELAASLSGGFDNVLLVSQMVGDFNTQCNLHLISNRPISFYDRQGNLKPEFDWYVNGLKRLQRAFARLADMINNGALPATRAITEELNK